MAGVDPISLALGALGHGSTKQNVTTSQNLSLSSVINPQITIGGGVGQGPSVGAVSGSAQPGSIVASDTQPAASLFGSAPASSAASFTPPSVATTGASLLGGNTGLLLVAGAVVLFFVLGKKKGK